jgi:hypothetical protein
MACIGNKNDIFRIRGLLFVVMEDKLTRNGFCFLGFEEGWSTTLTRACTLVLGHGDSAQRSSLLLQDARRVQCPSECVPLSSPILSFQ